MVELDDAAKKAALEEAMKKRQTKTGGNRKTGPDVSAALREAEERKNGKKKGASKEPRDL